MRRENVWKCVSRDIIVGKIIDKRKCLFNVLL